MVLDMYCSQCGKPIKEEDNFCSHCRTQKSSLPDNSGVHAAKEKIKTLAVVLFVMIILIFGTRGAWGMIKKIIPPPGENNITSCNSESQILENGREFEIKDKPSSGYQLIYESSVKCNSLIGLPNGDKILIDDVFRDYLLEQVEVSSEKNPAVVDLSYPAETSAMNFDISIDKTAMNDVMRVKVVEYIKNMQYRSRITLRVYNIANNQEKLTIEYLPPKAKMYSSDYPVQNIYRIFVDGLKVIKEEHDIDGIIKTNDSDFMLQKVLEFYDSNNTKQVDISASKNLYQYLSTLSYDSDKNTSYVILGDGFFDDERTRNYSFNAAGFEIYKINQYNRYLEIKKIQEQKENAETKEDAEKIIVPPYLPAFYTYFLRDLNTHIEEIGDVCFELSWIEDANIDAGLIVEREKLYKQYTCK